MSQQIISAKSVDFQADSFTVNGTNTKWQKVSSGLNSDLTIANAVDLYFAHSQDGNMVHCMLRFKTLGASTYVAASGIVSTDNNSIPLEFQPIFSGLVVFDASLKIGTGAFSDRSFVLNVSNVIPNFFQIGLRDAPAYGIGDSVNFAGQQITFTYPKRDPLQ